MGRRWVGECGSGHRRRGELLTVAMVRPATMLPPPELLPDVLPTERLLASGVARPAIRAELRHIPDFRNCGTIVGAYFQCAAVLVAAVAIHRPLAWAVAFALMLRIFSLLGVLAHEAVHRLLFTTRWLNDGVGRWLLAYPILLPFDLYRRAHIAHHRDELNPDDIDLGVYESCPMTPASLRRKLTRDLFLVSGCKVLRSLLRGLGKPATRPDMARLLAVQAMIVGGFTLAGRPELYLFLWLMPWMTLWRATTRLRLMAEHGGLIRSDDRRFTTHHVRQSWLSGFWMVPYNLGWHLAHHVDMGVPFRNLPTLHRELVAAGWVPPALEYQSYLALWRKAASAE